MPLLIMKPENATAGREDDVISSQQRRSKHPSTSNIHIGSCLDDLLEADGTLQEVQEVVAKRVLAERIKQEMSAQKVSKSAMANQMGTSRASLDRLLDTNNTSVNLKTIAKAARVLGKYLAIDLVDTDPTLVH